MSMYNREIAEIFYEMANLLEIDEANPFRVRAYRNAASFISAYPHSLEEMIKKNKDLAKLPGIGHDLSEKIQVIVKTGQLPELAQLEKRIPKTIVLIMRLPGLGPKRAKALFQQLKIKNLEDLEKAGKAHKIRELSGFSDKTEQSILSEIAKKIPVRRYLFSELYEVSKELLAYLKKFRGIQKVVIAGSYRRKKDTIGDLDILATAHLGKEAIDYFVQFNQARSIISQGKTRATIQLRSGLQVDFRVVPEASYGAALVYFTGSKRHIITLRKMAQDRNLKINEYGVFKKNKKIAGKTEEEVYRALDLSYIEPELRENHGEIEAARNGELPKLIQLKDIRGDLHCHTHATDGRDSLKAMAQAAQELGYEYIAITDHTQHLAMVHGQKPKQVLAQIKMIDKLNEKFKIRILKSAEVDILENGDLDLPDYVLEQLDLTVCSIHSKFNLSLKKQTERILRAMHHPCFTILAHPSGRILNRRAPYEIDYEKIFLAAKKNHCFIELNAQPERMDITDDQCRLAKEMGIKIAISSDAHSADQFNFISYGLNQARRGWLEPEDVLNTRPLYSFLKMIKKF